MAVKNLELYQAVWSARREMIGRNVCQLTLKYPCLNDWNGRSRGATGVRPTIGMHHKGKRQAHHGAPTKDRLIPTMDLQCRKV